MYENCDHPLDWNEKIGYNVTVENKKIKAHFCPVCGIDTRNVTRETIEELIKSGKIIEDEHGGLHAISDNLKP